MAPWLRSAGKPEGVVSIQYQDGGTCSPADLIMTVMSVMGSREGDELKRAGGLDDPSLPVKQSSNGCRVVSGNPATTK